MDVLMDAFSLAEHLAERGIDLRLADGHLIVKPASLLTEQERQAIAHQRDALIRLLSADYSDLPDGWQSCPAIPSRAVLIRRGRLIDSVCFESKTAAQDFLRLEMCALSPATAIKMAGRAMTSNPPFPR